MSKVKTKDGVEIFYKDWGKGQPIVFSHGWPLSADDWDAQMMFFVTRGYRVIAHDRRGHGRSSQPWDGNENPGPIETEGAQAAGLTERFQKFAAVMPLGRVGQPDDIALAVVFLASEDSHWITGESLYVTGGLR